MFPLSRGRQISLLFSFKILKLFFLNEKSFSYLSDLASLFLCFPLQCSVIYLLPHCIFHIIQSYNDLALDRGLWKRNKTPPSFSLILSHRQTTAKGHYSTDIGESHTYIGRSQMLGFFSVNSQKDILTIPDL